jgi:hypothetical protein
MRQMSEGRTSIGIFQCSVRCYVDGLFQVVPQSRKEYITFDYCTSNPSPDLSPGRGDAEESYSHARRNVPFKQAAANKNKNSSRDSDRT